jgi:hypothetical protein
VLYESLQSDPGIAIVHRSRFSSSPSFVITNRSAAAPIRRALVLHLGAFFTPYTLAMFILGLWLGYLGAVEEFHNCRRETRDHSLAAACPEWITVDN